MSGHGRMAGSCHLFLGDHRRAREHLETTARQACDGSKAHAIVLGNLALAHLRERELGQAVAALHQALNLVETTRGGGGLTSSSPPDANYKPGGTNLRCKRYMTGS